MNYFFIKSCRIFFYIIGIILVLSTFSCAPKHKDLPPNGYIVTSPELAEIIYYLNAGENLKGVTIECDYPPKLKRITRIGSFGKIDIEKVLEINPEIVFLTGLEQEAIKNELLKLSIRTETFYINSIDEMENTIIKLGKILNCEEKSTQLIEELQIIIDSMGTTPLENSPDVYVEIYGNPIMSVADSSLVGELVEIAGGNNIFSNLPRAYSRINPERIIEADPDIIIITYPGVDAQKMKDRKGWEHLKASRNNRIYTTADINPDLFLRASPRVIEGLKQLRDIFND